MQSDQNNSNKSTSNEWLAKLKQIWSHNVPHTKWENYLSITEQRIKCFGTKVSRFSLIYNISIKAIKYLLI